MSHYLLPDGISRILLPDGQSLLLTEAGSEVAGDLLSALWEALAASGELEEAFGKPAGDDRGWLQWQGGKASLPYVVMSSTEFGSPDYTTSGSSVRTVSVLIVVYARTKPQARSLGSAIRSVLDPIDGYDRLVFEDGEELSRFPGESGVPNLDPNRDAGGSSVWAYRLPIDFLISSN